MLILNICVFSSTTEKETLILYFFQKIKNLEKLQSIVNIFVFPIKISCFVLEMSRFVRFCDIHIFQNL